MKPRPPKIPMWVTTLIIGGIILGVGEVFFKLTTQDNDLTGFGWIGRLIGGAIVIIGIYLRVKPRKRF